MFHSTPSAYLSNIWNKSSIELIKFIPIPPNNFFIFSWHRFGSKIIFYLSVLIPLCQHHVIYTATGNQINTVFTCKQNSIELIQTCNHEKLHICFYIFSKENLTQPYSTGLLYLAFSTSRSSNCKSGVFCFCLYKNRTKGRLVWNCIKNNVYKLQSLLCFDYTNPLARHQVLRIISPKSAKKQQFLNFPPL